MIHQLRRPLPQGPVVVQFFRPRPAASTLWNVTPRRMSRFSVNVKSTKPASSRAEPQPVIWFDRVLGRSITCDREFLPTLFTAPRLSRQLASASPVPVQTGNLGMPIWIRWDPKATPGARVLKCGRRHAQSFHGSFRIELSPDASPDIKDEPPAVTAIPNTSFSDPGPA